VTLQSVVCVLCGAGWAFALAWRAPEGALRSAARGLLGGLAAFAAAWGGYSILERCGMRVSWEAVTSGGGAGVANAAAIGLVEESAKLLGMSLASLGTRPTGRGAIGRTVLAVAATFATLECMFVLAGANPEVLLLRALLAPVAHAALAAPLGLALVGGRRGLRWALPALLLSATLHGASDLSLAIPAFGRLGYAAVLAAPAVFLHLHTRLSWARERAQVGGRAV
jgi:RsiW-degrading membrane proteinase PrsW (M82 family)